MRTVGILGGGFGMYGYLAATHHLPCEVITLEKYRAFLIQRDDLKHLIANTVFLDNESQLIEQANTLVLARRPEDQQTQTFPAHISHAILEKPLATNPKEALRLLNNIKHIRFEVGYTLLLTQWAKKLKQNFNTINRLSIDWSFRSHANANRLQNWKTQSVAGGGVLNFFAIHLLGLAVYLGDCKLLNSRFNDHSGFIQLLINDIPSTFNISTNSIDTHFIVSTESTEEKMVTPFDLEPNYPPDDIRVSLIVQLFEVLWHKQPLLNQESVIQLWQLIDQSISKQTLQKQ